MWILTYIILKEKKNKFIVSLINGISKHQIFLIHSFSYYRYFYLQSLTKLQQKKKYILFGLFLTDG